MFHSKGSPQSDPPSEDIPRLRDPDPVSGSFPIFGFVQDEIVSYARVGTLIAHRGAVVRRARSNA